MSDSGLDVGRGTPPATLGSVRPDWTHPAIIVLVVIQALAVNAICFVGVRIVPVYPALLTLFVAAPLAAGLLTPLGASLAAFRPRDGRGGARGPGHGLRRWFWHGLVLLGWSVVLGVLVIPAATAFGQLPLTSPWDLPLMSVGVTVLSALAVIVLIALIIALHRAIYDHKRPGEVPSATVAASLGTSPRTWTIWLHPALWAGVVLQAVVALLAEYSLRGEPATFAGIASFCVLAVGITWAALRPRYRKDFPGRALTAEELLMRWHWAGYLSSLLVVPLALLVVAGFWLGLPGQGDATVGALFATFLCGPVLVMVGPVPLILYRKFEKAAQQTELPHGQLIALGAALIGPLLILAAVLAWFATWGDMEAFYSVLSGLGTPGQALLAWASVLAGLVMLVCVLPLATSRRLRAYFAQHEPVAPVSQRARFARGMLRR